MLETYYQEIKRHKRKQYLFWIVVLIFAVFLYYFFQGKYITINLGWNSLFPTNYIDTHEQTHTGGNIHIKSFGAISIKTQPKDAVITINGDVTSGLEKGKFMDYGNYTVNISHHNYIPGTMKFTLNDNFQVHMDNIFLLEKPVYSKIGNTFDGNIAKINKNTLALVETDTITFVNSALATQKISTKQPLSYIGSGKFLSGSTLVEYDSIEKTWIPEKQKLFTQYLKNCDTPVYEHSVLQCPENQSLITHTGKVFTGILQITPQFVHTPHTLLLGDISTGTPISYTLSGATLSPHTLQTLTEKEGEFFTGSGGSIVSFPDSTQNTPIKTGLSDIFAMQFVKDIFFAFGTKNQEPTLAIISINQPGKIHYIPLPKNHNFHETITIQEKNNNFFIQIPDALFFLYHEGMTIHPLVENGNMLTCAENFCLYTNPQDEIWSIQWKNKI